MDYSGGRNMSCIQIRVEEIDYLRETDHIINRILNIELIKEITDIITIITEDMTEGVITIGIRIWTREEKVD